MQVLSLDSTAVSASVAICRDDVLVAEYTLNTGLTHSETLLPMIESVLHMAHVDVNDIDIFACNAGPGSFTGVRIGAATIKGLAFGKNKPCVAVSTLDSLALNASHIKGIICPAMNARRRQVYNALFESDGKNVTRLTPDRAISLDDLSEELLQSEKFVSLPIYIVGDGAEMTFDVLVQKGFVNAILLPDRLLHQSAYSTAICALEMYKNGDLVTDAELKPTYLRPSQAERERESKLNS